MESLPKINWREDCLSAILNMRLKLEIMNTRGIISLAAAALIIAVTSAHAASIVWTNTAGGNWSDTNSWDPNQMPGSGDVAVITNDGTYSVTLDVNPTIVGLVLGTSGGANVQSLSVSNNQTFTLNGTAQVSTNGQFNLNGGVLSGNIVLCGALNCLGGTLSGGLTVNSNSVLTVSAPGVSLNGFTTGGSALTNYGTVNWTGGDISCDYSPQIYNYGLWNAQTDNSIFGQQTSGNGVFNNYGTFRKSGGSNTTTIDTNAVFNGSGMVDVESGTVSIANGQYAGMVNAAGGTFLSLGSSLIFGGGTLFTGTGSVEGSVIGSNAVFSGTMTCSGVTISGAITVATNAIVNLGTSGVSFNTSYNNTALLTNYGTINWRSDLTCDGGPQIFNFGLWNAQTDNTLFGQQTSGNTMFNNFGIFRKSGGTNTSTMDFNTIFNSSGTVDVESGTMAIIKGHADGAANVAGGATLSPGNNFVFAGSTLFSGTGNVAGLLNGNNALFSGVLNCSGTTLSGTITLATNSVFNLGTSNVNLSGVALTNYGTANWAGCDIDCNNNPQIYNYGLWNAQTDNTLFGQQTSGNATFNNFGTFRKSGGSNTTKIDANTVFNGSGTVDVESGTVSITNGQYTGGVNAAAGATLSPGNNFVFTGSTLFSGTGSVSGFVNGSNAVFSGTMNCSGVTISGAITVATNAVVNLGTSGVSFNTSYNNTALLTNYGTINWSAGNFAGDNNPKIYNYGLWNDQSDNTLFGQQTSGNTTFNNIGIFRKSGTSGITTLDNSTVFNNTGTLDVQSGTLSILGGRTLTGGTLNFGINSLNTFGHIALAGAVTLTGTVSANLNSLYTPTNGTSFALLAYGSESGVFSGSNLPAFFGWTNIYGPAAFSLKIVSAPQQVLNVTNYGAIGDAVKFFANTTSNSVVVTTTNQIPNTAIGDAIEVFGAGIPTTSINNQDLVTTIANVVNGTNITLAQVCQQTLTNTFATYGFNNSPSFKNAIAAVGTDTNDIIYIPSGTYLLLPTLTSSGLYSTIYLRRGGINFIGAGTNSTTLLSQGAWTYTLNWGATRGQLIQVASPITNNFPLSFSYLTMDGGVQQGNTGNHSFPASITTGNGWDVTHDAFELAGSSSVSLYHEYFTNVVVQHWRGEEFKSVDGSTNGRIGIYNCTFADGNATALNIYPAWDVRTNIFINLFQIAEYYQAYSSYPGLFAFNYITNITGNGFAVNGGKGNNPPFVIYSNIFYIAQNYSGILTSPADNLLVESNLFYGLGLAFDLGCVGYQGTFDNSNIVVAYNNCIGTGSFLIMYGGGSTSANRIESVKIYDNTLNTSANNATFLQTYSWTTNVLVSNNVWTVTGGSFGTLSTYAGNAQDLLVQTNNIYYSGLNSYMSSPRTNQVNYSSGSRFEIYQYFAANSGGAYALVDTNASQIPVGAQILIYNDTSDKTNVPIYLNSGATGSPVMLPYGQTALFYWQDWASAWSTNPAPPPPTNVRLNF
jgi:hypothetical protein